jgi:RNA polymerase sigma factor, sigma-70 family
MRGFKNNKELANDCFLYVWEKLREDESRRIKTFKGESSFQTFLYSVTSKLVIDFRRIQFGYKVLPKYYWEFDEINQHIFKLFFYQNQTPGWAENAAQAEFRISEEEAQTRVEEVERRMRESRLRLEKAADKEAVLLGERVDTIVSEDKRANPEESIIMAEVEEKRKKILEALKEEVEKLEDEDALILQLYFEQGLTAKEISGAIPGIKEKSVYKRIEKALRNLKKHLQQKDITEGDIQEIFENMP